MTKEKQPTIPEVALILINRADIKASEAEAVISVKQWLVAEHNKLNEEEPTIKTEDDK